MPSLPEKESAALVGMEPAEAVEYALAEGRRFYTFEQISGFMREQQKAEQCLAQAELSIPMLRTALGLAAEAGVDESLLDEARRMAAGVEQERLKLLASARQKGMRL